jgi:transcriptional regulator with XRE-family HTH domain
MQRVRATRGRKLNRKALVMDFMASQWRQVDLARETGLTRATVSLLLSSERKRFDVSTLQAIARVFQVPFSRYVLKG